MEPKPKSPVMKLHGLLDRTFEISVILKGIDGVLEIVGGIILLLVSPATIDRLAVALTQHELSEDPHDFIATHILHTASTLTGTAVLLAALYLLLHGLLKLVLVVAVLKGKLWAYPWMLGFLGAFVAYQLYRLTFAPSLWLVLLTIFDVFVGWLTWLEYRKHQAYARPARPAGD